MRGFSIVGEGDFRLRKKDGSRRIVGTRVGSRVSLQENHACRDEARSRPWVALAKIRKVDKERRQQGKKGKRLGRR